MPTSRYPTKADIPAEQADEALQLQDGTFVVFEDRDTTELVESVKEERTRREAAEKNATKAARELKRLQETSKNPDNAVPDEVRKQIVQQAIDDYVDEHKPKWAAGESALIENRQLKVRTQLTEMALSEKGGVRKERFGKFEKLYGDDFDVNDTGTLIVKGKPNADVLKQIQSYKTDFPEVFVGNGGSGGNAPGNTGPSAPNTGAPTLESLLKNPASGLEFANQGT